jgi:SPP1 gp7 family putative phage head morphogenesis protein
MAVRPYLRSGSNIIARRANELWYRRRLGLIRDDMQQELSPRLRQFVETLSRSSEDLLPTDKAIIGREVLGLIHGARQRFRMPFEPRRTAENAARMNLRATDEWWARQMRGWVDLTPTALPQPRIRDAAPIATSQVARRRQQRLMAGSVRPLSTLTIIRGQEAIETAFAEAVDTNIGLITSIPEQYFGRMEEVLFEQVQSAERWESLVDRLRENISTVNNLSDYRVELIARDQSAKMAAAFNRARSEAVGVTRYTWQTAGDERVRETHAANDGHVFSYDDPPEETGNPGDDVNCRCAAVPYVELEEEEAA